MSRSALDSPPCALRVNAQGYRHVVERPRGVCACSRLACLRVFIYCRSVTGSTFHDVIILSILLHLHQPTNANCDAETKLKVCFPKECDFKRSSGQGLEESNKNCISSVSNSVLHGKSRSVCFVKLHCTSVYSSLQGLLFTPRLVI